MRAYLECREVQVATPREPHAMQYPLMSTNAVAPVPPGGGPLARPGRFRGEEAGILAGGGPRRSGPSVTSSSQPPALGGARSGPRRGVRRRRRLKLPLQLRRSTAGSYQLHDPPTKPGGYGGRLLGICGLLLPKVMCPRNGSSPDSQAVRRPPNRGRSTALVRAGGITWRLTTPGLDALSPAPG